MSYEQTKLFHIDNLLNTNQILEKKSYQSEFLNVYDNKPSDEFLLEDGYHLNQNGHKLVYQNILKVI